MKQLFSLLTLCSIVILLFQACATDGENATATTTAAPQAKAISKANTTTPTAESNSQTKAARRNNVPTANNTTTSKTPTAESTTQPTAAKTTTQPTAAKATTQPTAAKTTTQPTAAKATTQPTATKNTKGAKATSKTAMENKMYKRTLLQKNSAKLNAKGANTLKAPESLNKKKPAKNRQATSMDLATVFGKRGEAMARAYCACSARESADKCKSLLQERLNILEEKLPAEGKATFKASYEKAIAACK